MRSASIELASKRSHSQGKLPHNVTGLGISLRMSGSHIPVKFNNSSSEDHNLTQALMGKIQNVWHILLFFIEYFSMTPRNQRISISTWDHRAWNGPMVIFQSRWLTYHPSGCPKTLPFLAHSFENHTLSGSTCNEPRKYHFPMVSYFERPTRHIIKVVGED